MNTNGLNTNEIIESKNKYGTNKISSKKPEGFLKLLIESLGDPIIRILIIALGIKIVFLIKDFDWYETVGIVIAIFIASFISSISEYGSEKAFIKLQEESSKTKCRVRRNGKVEEIFVDDVVVGDIVILDSGDKIPADGIIVDGDIYVDESSLNGETKEAHKLSVSSYELNPKDENFVYRGTVVYSNHALMKVEKVGDKTYYGVLAHELQDKQPESPLKIKLRHLAGIISKIGYLGAILVSISYLFSKIVIANNFNFSLIVETVTNFQLMAKYILYALTLSVTIIVVAVPEGLPMMITLVLSSNMKRMLKNNVMVRKLIGIETAGSVNILFTDKTGTLTKGKLEVVGIMNGSLKEYRNEEEILKYPRFHELVKLSSIYNNASEYDEENKAAFGGNITDRAILNFIKTDKTKKYKIISSIPFDSKNKYSMMTIYKDRKITLVKGAPEKILPKCINYYDEFGNYKILNKREIESKIKESTRKGNRALVIAMGRIEQLDSLTFIGLIYIKDEVRKEAIEGLKLVRNAGIKTVMITGDNKDTAVSIGKEVGLLKDNNDLIFTSKEIAEKSDEELKILLPNIKIIARALPQDKSRLVRISQELGLVVGMTGDGVNDAPALKKADVGFSMGSGTEVAKEASDIIILDDNFLSISKAILFGRTIFKSIRKFIIFQLTVNICAVGLSIIGPFIGVDTPVTVIQMLWINMVMDTLAGLAFSFEPPLLEYMDENPKKKDESIINKYMLHEIFITGLYSFMLCILFLKLPIFKSIYNQDLNHLMSAFFGLFIFVGIFNCFNARTHRLNLFSHLISNKVFMIIIALIVIVQIVLIYFGGSIFRTVPLNLNEFIIMFLLALTVIPVDWIRKIFLRKRGIIGGV
ncbi:MAG: calcium-translocating P-type ATPase, PMCA-type [Clostridium sp.]|nr:calcium-translocating P-type ATPase, PMCA-type [Clostridium sp.]MCM1443921.1 calcium-translocating P-type ATPase, PMCA-type [Candidatus Amulumruptor caecigallinarius]